MSMPPYLPLIFLGLWCILCIVIAVRVWRHERRVSKYRQLSDMYDPLTNGRPAAISLIAHDFEASLRASRERRGMTDG
jgi:hypothetical protein